MKVFQITQKENYTIKILISLFLINQIKNKKSKKVNESNLEITIWIYLRLFFFIMFFQEIIIPVYLSVYLEELDLMNESSEIIKTVTIWLSVDEILK